MNVGIQDKQRIKSVSIYLGTCSDYVISNVGGIIIWPAHVEEAAAEFEG